jgi:hypothetical protein
LFQKRAYAIVLSHPVHDRLPPGIADKHVCARACSELDQSEILAAGSLVQEGCTCCRVEVGEVEEVGAGRGEEGKEGRGRGGGLGGGDVGVQEREVGGF